MIVFVQRIMIIFLLLYLAFVLIWLVWASVLTYHFFKFRFPNDLSIIFLAAFWTTSILILFTSFIFVANGNWDSTPQVIKNILELL